jgi:hypothetical protein
MRVAAEADRCSNTVSSAGATPLYDTASPPKLQTIAWRAGGTASCTSSMLSISYKIYAENPESWFGKNVIAQGNCTGCTQVPALSTSYTCVQGDDDCAGFWSVSTEVIYQAAPTKQFTSSTSGCVIAGSSMTCKSSVPAGQAKLFNSSALPGCSPSVQLSCFNLPPGGGVPAWSERSLDDVREYHFPDGQIAKNDPTKGLFRPSSATRT